MKFASVLIRKISNLSCINEKLACLQFKCANGENRHGVILYIYNLIKEYKLGFMDSRIDSGIEYSMIGISKNEIPSSILPKFVYILSKSMKKHHLKPIYDHFVFSIPFIPNYITYNLSLSLIKNGFYHDNTITGVLNDYLIGLIDNIDTPALLSLARLIEFMHPKSLDPENVKIIFDKAMKYIQHFDSSAGELLLISINFLYLGGDMYDIFPYISNILSKLNLIDHPNLITFCDLISKRSKSDHVLKFMNDSYRIIIDNKDVNDALKFRFFQAFIRLATANDSEAVSNMLKWISYGNFADIKIIRFLSNLSKLYKSNVSRSECRNLAKEIVPHINLLIDDVDSSNLSIVSQSMSKLNISLLTSRINFAFNKLLNDKYSTIPVNDFINVFWYLCKFNGFDKSSLKSTYRFIKTGVSGFSMRDISQILMGFSKIPVCPPFSTFSSISPSLLVNLNKCNSLDISYLLIGLNNLKNNNISKEYLKMVNYIYSNSIKLLKSSNFNFSIHELATIVKALSNSKYKSQTLLAQLYSQMYLHGIKLSYYRQSEVLLTFAYTGFNDESLIDRYLHSLLSSDNLSFKTISNILIFMSIFNRNNYNVISNYKDNISKLILHRFHTFPKWLKTICFITSDPNVSVKLIDFLCVKDLDEKESYRCFLSLPRLLSIGMDKKILKVSKHLSCNVRKIIPELSTGELLQLLMACYDLGYSKPKLIKALRSKIVENCCNYRFNVSELADVCDKLVWINAYEKLPNKLQASIYCRVPSSLQEKLTISENVNKKIKLFTPSNLGPPSI